MLQDDLKVRVNGFIKLFQKEKLKKKVDDFMHMLAARPL